MTEVPHDLSFDVERTSVRVVLLDSTGRLLLFRTVDPTAPEEGVWWELPGGGMEPGESTAQTAVRELAEETGIVVPTADIGPASWARAATYRRRGRRILQHERVVSVQLDEPTPAVSRSGRTEEELTAYVEDVWWSPEQVAASPDRFFPGALPRLLGPFLTGESITEPFEYWN
jgi:8-oxo-dGTP pyrophosphatase MutT (NUDIX family)